MIGNDVVDLKLAAEESNWRRKGFLKKVFSQAEQQLICASKNQEVSLWLLWSMKEAAYKAHQREFNLPRSLNWLAQECYLGELASGKASGEVHIDEQVYLTSSEITAEYIYTSAESANNKAVKNKIFEASSSEVKEKLRLELSRKFALDPTELQLEKDAFGMPFFSRNKSFFFNRFSLSGHGRYSAYNLSLINCETPVKHS